MKTKLSEIKYIDSTFQFHVNNTTYNVQFENLKPPYLVNIFRGGTYQLTINETSLHPNKSNAKDFLFIYLNKS